MNIYELLKLLGKNAAQQYGGAGEAGLSAATGIFSGAAAPIGGAIATYQNNGANPYEQEIMNFMQRNTYAPRTEVGQQRAEQIGEFANRNLVPIAPMLEGLALPLTAGSRAKYNPTAARATLEQIVPDYVSGGNISKAANSNDVVAAMMNDPQLRGFAEYFKQNAGKAPENVVPYKEANRVPQQAVAVDNGLLQANAEKQLANYNSRGYTKDVIAKAQQEFDKTGKLPEGYVASKEDGVLYPKPSSLLEDVTDFGKPIPAEKNNTVTLRHKTSGKEIEVTKEGAKSPFYVKEFDVVSPNESLLGDFVDFGKPVPAGKQDTVTLRHNTSGKEIVVTKEGAKAPFYTKEWSPLDPYVEQADNHFNEFSKMYTSFTDPESPFFTDGGRINSTDNWREVFPIYRENRNKSALVHEGASELSKKWYAKKLSEPVPKGFDNAVLFTAGGTGAGKTSAIQQSPILKPLADKANIIYDTNMNGLKSSVKKIEQALDANRDVDIVYTYRDPEEALRKGALTRAMNMEKNYQSGRTVPLNEHLKTHMGSYDTMFKLREIYKDDPRVSIRAINNSFGKGNSKVVPLDKIPKLNENEVSPRLKRALEEEYKSGRISKNIYDATKVQ